MAAEANASFDDVLDVLREWAHALRRAWGGIDGRSCKTELDLIADQLELAHDRGEASMSLSWLRQEAGVCPQGGGHWEDPDTCVVHGCKAEDE